MDDIINRLEGEAERLSFLSFDSAGMGIAANVVNDAVEEIKTLRKTVVLRNSQLAECHKEIWRLREELHGGQIYPGEGQL